MTEKNYKAKIWIIYFIFFIVYFLSLIFIFDNKKKSVQEPEEFIERIDSLDSKIDSIYIVKDEVQEKIDTVYIKLEDNNKQHEENFNRIINNDANEDYVFFLDYINANRARLDSISNSL